MKRVLKQIIILLIIVNSFTLIACSNNQTTLSKQTGFFNNSENYLNANDDESENSDNTLGENLKQEDVDNKLDTVNNSNTSDIDKR